ncbi:hypothetical protein [Ornithinimicrobium kibberense]|uniref:hypothetical protein n=1 Tax=Ornithinimicrobium kibberense TaxID=282060 RepID=UPI00360A6C4F
MYSGGSRHSSGSPPDRVRGFNVSPPSPIRADPRLRGGQGSELSPRTSARTSGGMTRFPVWSLELHCDTRSRLICR